MAAGLRTSRRSPCRRVYTQPRRLHGRERGVRSPSADRCPLTIGRFVRRCRSDVCVAGDGHSRQERETTDRIDGKAAPRPDWRVCSVSRSDPRRSRRRRRVTRAHRHTRLQSGDWPVCDDSLPARQRSAVGARRRWQGPHDVGHTWSLAAESSPCCRAAGIARPGVPAPDCGRESSVSPRVSHTAAVPRSPV